jgi:peptidoglycan hydrolase FlgJ
MNNLINQSGNIAIGNVQGANQPLNANQQRARETAEEFEAFFLSQVFSSMSAGLETDPTFGGGESEKIFRDMLNNEYSTSMSRQGGIGIADAVYREILALQEI